MTRAERKNRRLFNDLVKEARKHITGETHTFGISMHNIQEADFPPYGTVTNYDWFKTSKVILTNPEVTQEATLTLFS